MENDWFHYSSCFSFKIKNKVIKKRDPALDFSFPCRLVWTVFQIIPNNIFQIDAQMNALESKVDKEGSEIERIYEVNFKKKTSKLLTTLKAARFFIQKFKYKQQKQSFI